MNPAVVRSRNDNALRKVIDELTAAITETLGGFVDRPIVVTPAGELRCVRLRDWLTSIAGTKAVIRGTLDGDDREHHLLLALDLVDAITLSGHLMLTSEEVIEADRDALAFDQDHSEAFSEVGNILCATITGALRREVGPQSGMRIRDFATVEQGSDPQAILGTGTALIYDFVLKIDEYPESRVSVLIDPETGQKWNDDMPVFVHYENAAQADPAATPATEASGAAVVRPKIAAYVTNVETASIIRECGVKIGVEIRHHARTDIPNPAAHPGEIVLIEIPVGEEKRFDWAKRLRQYHRDIVVVLLIHEPSRPRVVQGLLTKSNVILAWPSKAEQLRAKLEPLLIAGNENP